ncbi:MAG TPA: glycosyltransferase [Pyrinomonadaceae bacterium]|jgi:dolichol-phosphate mannosyltransferase|nr:glycosyltransferase [Pyrinomonadaceae bacterium]
MKAEVPDIAIVIPVLNERENLLRLLPLLKDALDEMHLSGEIIVADGGSVDGSQETAEQFGASVIVQHEKGFGGALQAGFAAAKAPYIVTMDADLSHRPDFLPTFWRERETAELLIASRFVEGGRADLSRFRLMLSRVLSLAYRRALGLQVLDLSSGFRMYRSGILDWRLLQAHDFDVQPEILFRIHARGFRIREVPFHYMERNYGKSHARLFRFGWSFSKTLFRMWRLRQGHDKAATYIQGVE